MNRLIVIILLTIPTCIPAQVKFSFDSEMRFDTDTIYPLDPIVLSIQITNASDTVINLLPPFFQYKNSMKFGSGIIIEYKINRSDRWNQLHLSSEGLENMYPIQPILALKPNESRSSNKTTYSLSDFLNFNDVDDGIKCYFRVNAKGLLPYYRAGYLANLKISTLFIKEYKGDDKMVYDYIRSLPNPTYFCAYRYTGYIGFLETGISESSYPYLRESLHVIEQFPNSQFIPWFNLYLATAYTDIARYHQVNHNKELSLEYIGKSREITNKLIAITDNKEINIFAEMVVGRQFQILEEVYQGVYNIPYQILQTYFKNE
jgi:hypothetical protein